MTETPYWKYKYSILDCMRYYAAIYIAIASVTNYSW